MFWNPKSRSGPNLKQHQNCAYFPLIYKLKRNSIWWTVFRIRKGCFIIRNSKFGLVFHSAKAIVLQFILELAKSLKIDPRGCFRQFFAKFAANDNPEYQAAFNDELTSFRGKSLLYFLLLLKLTGQRPSVSDDFSLRFFYEPRRHTDLKWVELVVN